jgi:Domain of unknown function (DUF4398)
MRLRDRVASPPSCSALLACLLALAVAACAGPGAHPALDDAHAALERARSAPRVRALAAAELDLAETALAQAEAAARAGAARAEVQHLAYIASQRAASAEARAAAQVARSETRLLRRALGQAAIEPRLQEQPTQPLAQKAQGRPALPGDDPPRIAAVAADQASPAPEPDAMAVEMEALPGHLTLDLAELPFEQAEPTAATLVELAGMAERMRRDPWRILLIEAAFDLPEPAARTLMERRVEVVRAFFLKRGVAPARVVVHAITDGRLRPPVGSLADPME